MALLDSLEAGASRRGGRRRCWFELVEGVGVIAPLVVLLRRADPLCARYKSRVAIYGTRAQSTQLTANPDPRNRLAKGTVASHAGEDRRA